MKNNKLDYLLVGLIIALTGFELLFRASSTIQLGILIGIAGYFFLKNKEFKPDVLLILILFSLPVIFQAAKFDLFQSALKGILALIIQLLICYFVLEITKDRFHITFVNIIYFLAIFSFVFYPTQFFPYLQDFIKSTAGSIIEPVGAGDLPEGFKSKTLIFFTYIHGYGQNIWLETLPRNCGAFWEPGMFTVFLNLALLINIYINRTKIFSKKNFVFIIAIITTFSTTGYITLFLIILSYFIFQKNIYRIILSIPIMLAIMYLSFKYVWALDFMNEKVKILYEARHDSRSSRFGAVLYHFSELKKFPLAGAVLEVSEKEAKLDQTQIGTSPNGLSLVFYVYGIPVGIIFFILLYRGISRWLKYNYIDNRILHSFFFTIFLLLAFSQDVTNRPFYRMFLFFIICIPSNSFRKELPEPE